MTRISARQVASSRDQRLSFRRRPRRSRGPKRISIRSTLDSQPVFGVDKLTSEYGAYGVHHRSVTAPLTRKSSRGNVNAGGRRSRVWYRPSRGTPCKKAETVFSDDNAIVLPDPDHSDTEERFLIIGLSAALRVLAVVHAEPEADNSIRLISARRATRCERGQYAARWKR